MYAGGGDRGYTPQPKPGNLDCTDLVIVTSLNSPNPAVINIISVGNELEIIRDGESVIAKYKNKVAGSITHFLYTDLLNCLKRGNKYVGHVIKITGGNCEIKIFHKSKK